VKVLKKKHLLMVAMLLIGSMVLLVGCGGSNSGNDQKNTGDTGG